jgi:hypothetical protein
MALSANQQVNFTTGAPQVKSVSVASGAIHIYKGALLSYNSSGYAKLTTDTSGETFCGVALEELNQATGGSNGDNKIKVIPVGSGALVKMKTGTISAASVNLPVYGKTDDQVELAATTSYDIQVGVIREVLSTTSAMVQI